MSIKFSEDIVPISDLKVNPGKIVRQLQEAHRPVVLTSRGRSVAVIQELHDYESDVEERAFMNCFFAKWLERDTKSSDRPSRLKPEYLELYIQLLEAVAAKYADQRQLDRLGFFHVSGDDTIDVRHQGHVVSVSIQRLLDRSGFVTADPLHPESDRYRFEPIWTHRLLLEMHKERHRRRAAQPVAVAQ